METIRGRYQTLTRPEEIAISLRNAGKTAAEIARELGLPIGAARIVLAMRSYLLRLWFGSMPVIPGRSDPCPLGGRGSPRLARA